MSCETGLILLVGFGETSYISMPPQSKLRVINCTGLRIISISNGLTQSGFFFAMQIFPQSCCKRAVGIHVNTGRDAGCSIMCLWCRAAGLGVI